MTERADFKWFEARKLDHKIIGIGEPGHFEDVKSFLVIGDNLALLTDSGMGYANIRAVVEHFTDKPILLVNTHGHLDQIGDNWRFERRWAHVDEVERIRLGVPNARMQHFLADDAFNRAIPPGLDRKSFEIPGTEVEKTVADGELIDLGNRHLRVLHTPGHSAGSISFLEESTGVLIAGDAVYEGPMFAHHHDANARQYRDTLQRLHDLASELSVVYPSPNRYPLSPGFITEIHEAMQSIWNGREPASRSGGVEAFDFGNFSFSFRETWRDEQGDRR